MREFERRKLRADMSKFILAGHYFVSQSEQDSRMNRDRQTIVCEAASLGRIGGFPRRFDA